MKIIVYIFISVLFIGCRSNRPIVLEKAEKKEVFAPEKLVIIGITNNSEARHTFEKQMQQKMMDRDIDTYPSHEITSVVFTRPEKAKKEISKLIKSISKKRFDSFMLTGVTGVEEKINEEHFSGIYKIYRLETDIYTIEDEEIVFVWGMCIDIYDYQLIKLPIEEYVKAVIMQMEYDNMLPRKSVQPKSPYTNS